MTRSAARPPSVASAALAERRARQQGRKNKNGNSNGWFGHGTLPAPFARRLRHHNDANRNLKFHRAAAGCQSASLVEQRVRGGQRMEGRIGGSRSSSRRQYLSRIENVLPIERLLQCAHGLDPFTAEFAREALPLALPHSVLSAAGATHSLRSVHHPIPY